MGLGNGLSGRDRGDERDLNLYLLETDPFGMDRLEGFEVEESGLNLISNDILHLLPSDPFGMDQSAISADRLEGFEVEEPRLNLISNPAVSFGSSDNGIVGIGESPNLGWGFDRPGPFERGWDVEEIWSSPSEDGGAPHDALLLSLAYLEAQDLLFAERVCRSFREAVQSDARLWAIIHIDKPLNAWITDHELLKLTGRAQGRLQSLSLVECLGITDDGLWRVLETNPRLTKLSVPGCTSLSIGGLVNNLKAFNSTGLSGIKCLRICGIYGITGQHFKELISLLNVDERQLMDARRPRFFHSRHLLPSNDDDECPIDIEICPKCERFRLLYDCPVLSCRGMQSSAQQCRACLHCIARCFSCGSCIKDTIYIGREETVDLCCWDCWKLVEFRGPQEGVLPECYPWAFGDWMD